MAGVVDLSLVKGGQLSRVELGRWGLWVDVL